MPAWWFIEITNVLAMAERKGHITATQSDAFIADLGKLGFERDDEAPDLAFTYLLVLCRKHRLTSYDAVYLDLAIRPITGNSSAVLSPPLTLFSLLSGATFLLLLVLFWRHNHFAYGRRYAQWERSFLCQRCGSLAVQE